VIKDPTSFKLAKLLSKWQEKRTQSKTYMYEKLLILECLTLIKFFQKQPIPVLDNLITPPFESDIKKSTALSTPKVTCFF
jgi:hypothetical protein